MISRAIAIASAAALVAIASCAEAGEQPPSPEVNSASASADFSPLMSRIYDAYLHGGMGIDWQDPAPIFEPELAAAINRLVTASEETMSIPDALAADPFCKCQDWGDFEYEVVSSDLESDKASVVVSTTNFGSTTQTKLELRRFDDGWRVYDIDDRFRDSVMSST